MSRTIYLSSFICMLVAAVAVGEPIKIDTAIREVTVYADRARVTRVAQVNLKQEEATYSIGPLPGWTVEESVRVAVSPAAVARILDVRVKRDYLARADDADVRAAQAAVQEITDKIREVEDERKALQQRRQHIESIRVFSLEKLPRDAALREVDVKSYAEVVDYVTQSVREILALERGLEIQLRELRPEQNARQRKRNELQKKQQLEQRTVLVTLATPAAAATEIRVTYMLPGATWEPAHELRAEGDNPRSVELASHAVVTQTTGEDWDGASLAFSTQSPVQPMKIPEMQALLLGRQAAPSRGAQQSRSFKKAQKQYTLGNTFLFELNNPDGDLNMFTDNYRNQRAAEGRASSVFRQLEDRGTTAHFAGRGRPIVRSDGQSVRVPIGKVQLAARTKIVAAPQVSLNAVRTLRLTNAGKQALLPGKVALYRSGAFLGATDIDFVASGEAFEVFLGVVDQIKLSRVLDRKQSALVRGKRTRLSATFEITAENLSSRPITLTISDRIPVSEHKDIRVSGVRITPVLEPDSRGIVDWVVTIGPKLAEKLRIQYRVEYPEAMLQQQIENPPSQDEGGQIFQDIQHTLKMM